MNSESSRLNREKRYELEGWKRTTDIAQKTQKKGVTRKKLRLLTHAKRNRTENMNDLDDVNVNGMLQ